MYYIDLDKPVPRGTPSPYKDLPANVLPFEASTFPGGEEHVKLRCMEGVVGPVTIIARLRNSRDVWRMILAAAACNRRGWDTYAFIPYLPYARQDRVMVAGEAPSLAVFMHHLSICNFRQIAFFDPHSDVTAAIADALRMPTTIVTNELFINRVRSQLPETILVAPDAGAAKKLERLYPREQLVVGHKVRDLNTGLIEKYELHGDVAGKECLVVDDICDGGATFELLGDALTAGGAAAKHLAVSHGIFSKGLHTLSKVYSTISTTDSFWNKQESPAPSVHQLIPPTFTRSA